MNPQFFLEELRGWVAVFAATTFRLDTWFLGRQEILGTHEARQHASPSVPRKHENPFTLDKYGVRHWCFAVKVAVIARMRAFRREGFERWDIVEVDVLRFGPWDSGIGHLDDKECVGHLLGQFLACTLLIWAPGLGRLPDGSLVNDCHIARRRGVRDPSRLIRSALVRNLAIS